MRYCLNCRHITHGEPLYCNACGRSYDAKLCPSRHVNPRTAEVCSECGSRDFSIPAPRASARMLLLLWAIKIMPGAILLLLTVSVLIGFVQMLTSDPEMMRPFLAAGLIVALLWYLYLQLPHSIRKLFHTSKSKNGKGHSGHGH